MDIVEFEIDEKKDLGVLVNCNLKFLIVIYSATHKLIDEIMGQFIDRTKSIQTFFPAVEATDASYGPFRLAQDSGHQTI